MTTKTKTDICEANAKRIIGNALTAGYLVSVNDGEEWVVKKSTNKAEIVAALFSTGSDTIRLRKADGENVGLIMFVYNYGDPDVVCDHTDKPEIAALLGPEMDGKL